ncbi:hypothetical protein [Mycolicibacterium sp. BiH015]|uniref:hypothetical protein n=1 Tax=Mycolicibacterium sp. BiH015 TaxID=3018808 RepID=UPI003FA542B4
MAHDADRTGRSLRESALASGFSPRGLRSERGPRGHGGSVLGKSRVTAHCVYTRRLFGFNPRAMVSMWQRAEARKR